MVPSPGALVDEIPGRCWTMLETSVLGATRERLPTRCVVCVHERGIAVWRWPGRRRQRPVPEPLVAADRLVVSFGVLPPVGEISFHTSAGLVVLVQTLTDRSRVRAAIVRCSLPSRISSSLVANALLRELDAPGR